MKAHYIVSSMTEAWKIADQIFPTDYIQNAKYSENAGYPIYTSTAAGVTAWISDLGTSLELNLPDGQTVRIHVEEPDAWDYDGQY